jgi:hypothetical protein
MSGCKQMHSMKEINTQCTSQLAYPSWKAMLQFLPLSCINHFTKHGHQQAQLCHMWSYLHNKLQLLSSWTLLEKPLMNGFLGSDLQIFRHIEL